MKFWQRVNKLIDFENLKAKNKVFYSSSPIKTTYGKSGNLQYLTSWGSIENRRKNLVMLSLTDKLLYILLDVNLL